MKRAKSSSRKSDKSKKEECVINEEECLITDDESFGSFQTSIIIEEKEITQFLTSRKTLFSLYNNTKETLQSNDCISVVSGKIKINDSIIDSTIDGYVSKGCYGLVFIGSNSSTTNKYIIKIIPSSNHNKKEIETMKEIMNYNIQPHNNIIPNYVYLLSYYLNCNEIKDHSNSYLNIIRTNITAQKEKDITSRTPKTPKTTTSNKKNTIQDGSYSIIIMEQFDETIKNLLSLYIDTDRCFIDIDNYTSDNIELFNSIFAQIILSLYILHNKFKYYHNDAHLSNIFYKKITKDNKYFYYNINGINYYIKNCGYLVVLGDFGLSEKINIPDNLIDLEKLELRQEKNIEELNNNHSTMSLEEKEDLYQDIEKNIKILDELQLFHLNLIRDYNKLLKYLNYIYIQGLGEARFISLINDIKFYHLIKIFLRFTCYPDTDSNKYIMCKNNIKQYYQITQEAKLENIFLDIMMSLFNIKKHITPDMNLINESPYTCNANE